jgi:hypothetical protein
MRDYNPEIFELKAGSWKTFAYANLLILSELRKGERSESDLVSAMGLPGRSSPGTWPSG